MQEIIIRAGAFIAIIVLGYVLRRIHFFKESDFSVLSKIVLKITLPAAIVSSFSGKEIDPALFSLALISLGTGILYMFLMYVLDRKRGRSAQAFEMLNISGYNIGNFTLSVRYGVAVVLALGCYFLLPFSLEVRQALVVLAFSPIASSAPAFTEDLKEDVGLASAVNSVSIICSIGLMVGLLLLMT